MGGLYMANKAFIEIKIPIQIANEVDELVSSHTVQKEHRIKNREDFVIEALNNFIEKVKTTLPGYKLSQILESLGY
jgi:hypothetical protein